MSNIQFYFKISSLLIIADIDADEVFIFEGKKVSAFKDRFVECSIEKIQSWKQLLMYENVTYNGKYYENVAIVEDGTEIGFAISSRNRNGFGFDIKSAEGGVIAKDLYGYSITKHLGVHLFDYVHKMKKIRIASTNEMPTQDANYHKHITVTVWRLDSFKYHTQRRKIYNENNPFPDNLNQTGFILRKQLLKNAIFTAIEPAMIRPGENSDWTASEVSNVVEDRNDILGRIEIDFFIMEPGISHCEGKSKSGLCKIDH